MVEEINLADYIQQAMLIAPSLESRAVVPIEPVQESSSIMRASDAMLAATIKERELMLLL